MEGGGETPRGRTARWQLPGQEPLPLRDLLQRAQHRLRALAGAASQLGQ